MKAVILALALTLVGCQQQIDQTDLNPDKVLSYIYEFQIQNRVPGEGFSSAGMKAKCKIEIGHVDQDWKFLQVHSFEAMDYNGMYPRTDFVASPSLSAMFEKQLKNLIVTYQYKNGHVENIMAPGHISEFALNLYKGILNMFECTIKSDQKNYNLRENGIDGKCDTTYFIQNTEKPDEFLMTKTKDLTDCDNMALKVVGAAYVTPCQLCRQKNRNFQATATSNYRIKVLKGRNDKLILQANVQEIRLFTPFNEQNGKSVIMEARQKMEFFETHNRFPQIPIDLKKYGSLSYNFKNSDLPLLPVPLSKIKNRNKEIEDGLHYLANENFPKDGKRFMHLVNLLRTDNEINYSEVFDPFFSQPMHRATILDLISAVGTSVALKYVSHKIVQQEITSTEAAQTLLVFFHFCNASEEVVEEAMAIVTEVLKGPQSLYCTSICLCYGTLLSRFYAVSDTISDKYLKPLTDFATKAISSSDIDASVLALKAFGNVEHQIVLKPIMKYLQTAIPSDVRIQRNAIMALRNPGKKDPIRVQGFLLQIIMNYQIAPIVRACGTFVLMELKPKLPVLIILTNAMLHEPSIQVKNFVYMYLSTMARSTAPELQVMASACKMALNVLCGKIQAQAGYQFSSLYFTEFLDEFYKARLAVNSIFLHTKESTSPTFIMTNFKANIMGSIISLLEVGIESERIKEIIEKLQEASKGGDWNSDSQQLQKVPSDQKIIADELTVLELYVKIFGKEILTGNVKMNLIPQLIKAYHGKVAFPGAKYFIDVLKNRQNIRWEKYFMSAEVQRSVPTCTGLPWQIGLVHVAHTKVTGNVQLLMTPEPTSEITWPEIININTKLKTRLTLRMKKDMILTVGTITPEIHAFLEKKATLTATVPINADVTVNIKENTFKLELPPCKQETDIISLRLKTSAITSNTEEAPAATSTPVFLPKSLSKTIEQPFDFPSAERDERKDILPSEKKSVENLDAQLEEHLESVHQTMCFETRTFGCKVCFDWATMYDGCTLGKSIYNFIGEHVFKLSLKESDTKAPIQKLQFSIQGGARAAEQMVPLLRNEEKDLVIKKRVKITLNTTEESSESSSSSSAQDRVSKKKIDLKQVPTQQQQDNDQEQQEQDQKRHQGQQHHPLEKKLQLDDTSSSSSSSRQQKGSSSSSSSSNNSDSSSESSSSSDTSRSDSSDSTQENKHINGRHRKEKSGKSYPSGEKGGDEKEQAKRPAVHCDEKQPINSNQENFFPARVQGLQWATLTFKESQIEQEQSSSPSSYSEASRKNEFSLQQEAKTPGDVLLPYVTAVAEAVRNDSKKQGYAVSLYGKHDAYKTHFKMAASEFNQAKWRACLDSLLSPFIFQNSLSWGHKCKDYKIEIKMSSGQVARYAAIQTIMKWTKLPFLRNRHASWSMDFLPEIAYRLGFSTAYQKNPAREITFRIIAKSPEASAVIFKAPDKTFYRDDFCTAFLLPDIPIPYYQTPKLSTFNLASWLDKGIEATCEVQDERITTFDNKIFNTSIAMRECDLLIVKDCTTSESYKPQFLIWIQNPKPGLSKEIHMSFNSVEIIIRVSLGTLSVLRNKEPILTNRERYEDIRASIVISKTTNTVIVKAPEHGLESVTYDGVILRIIASAKMKGNTCGLCGDYNGEIKHEYLMPHRVGTERH
ncbi:vitellogenin-1-like [Candoia aspera]|uniref:vitellogenin-1-like n=1 Tax=Candoia aspera TaxID=51853 RepID=UPI002FD8428B